MLQLSVVVFGPGALHSSSGSDLECFPSYILQMEHVSENHVFCASTSHNFIDAIRLTNLALLFSSTLDCQLACVSRPGEQAEGCAEARAHEVGSESA